MDLSNDGAEFGLDIKLSKHKFFSKPDKVKALLAWAVNRDNFACPYLLRFTDLDSFNISDRIFNNLGGKRAFSTGEGRIVTVRDEIGSYSVR